MSAENFVVDYGRDGELVEDLGKLFPYFDVVSSLALLVEPVEPVYLGGLVVSSQEKKNFGIFYFIGQ